MIKHLQASSIAHVAAYSALDAYERPLVTLEEMAAFLDQAGEFAEPRCLLYALADMRNGGSVLVVLTGDQRPRYVLRLRMRQRRALREWDRGEYVPPWGA